MLRERMRLQSDGVQPEQGTLALASPADRWGTRGRVTGWILLLCIATHSAAYASPQPGDGFASTVARGDQIISGAMRDASPRAIDVLSGLPLRFEPIANESQGARGYRVYGRGVNGYVSGAGIELILDGEVAKTYPDDGSRAPEAAPAERVAIRLDGARGRTPGSGEQPLSSTSSYLLGNDPSKWRRDVVNFARVRFESVYPGIDVVYRSADDGSLEYDLVVSPGAGVDAVRLSVQGAGQLSVSADGELRIETPAGRIVRQHVPVLHQEIHGKRRAWQGAYTLADDGAVALELGSWDRAHALVIDPVVEVGAWRHERADAYGDPQARAIALHKAGELVVIASSIKGLRATEIAHETDELEGALPGAVTAGGETVVVGEGPADPGVSNDILLTRFELSPVDEETGNQPHSMPVVTYTYIGGMEDDLVRDVAYGRDGRIVLGGATNSPDLPHTQGELHTPEAQKNPLIRLIDSYDGFVLVLEPSKPVASGAPNPVADDLVYGTFLGGSRRDEIRALTVSDDGRIFAVGQTRSADLLDGFPVDAGVVQANRTACKTKAKGASSQNGTTCTREGMIWGLDPNAASQDQDDNTGGDPSLIFGTYLGGNSFDDLTDIVYDGRARVLDGGAIDSDTLDGNIQYGAIAVLGLTDSADFPPAGPSTGASDTGIVESVLTVLDAEGKAILAQKRLDNAMATGLAIDARGRLVISGFIHSAGLPPVADLDIVRYTAQSQSGESIRGGGRDAFVARLAANWEAWEFFTYLGLDGQDSVVDVAADLRGNTHVLTYFGIPGNDSPGAYLTDSHSDAALHGYHHAVLDRGGELRALNTLNGAMPAGSELITVSALMAVNVFGRAYFNVMAKEPDNSDFTYKLIAATSEAETDEVCRLKIDSMPPESLSLQGTTTEESCGAGESCLLSNIALSPETIPDAENSQQAYNPAPAIAMAGRDFEYQVTTSYDNPAHCDTPTNLTYFIQPLPLPDNAAFDYETGAFKLHADESNWGSNVLQITASDGKSLARQVIELVVVEPYGPEPLPAVVESYRASWGASANPVPNLLKWTDDAPVLALTQTYKAPGEVVPVFDAASGFDRWGKREFDFVSGEVVHAEGGDAYDVTVALDAGYHCMIRSEDPELFYSLGVVTQNWRFGSAPYSVATFGWKDGAGRLPLALSDTAGTGREEDPELLPPNGIPGQIVASNETLTTLRTVIPEHSVDENDQLSVKLVRHRPCG